MEQITKKFELTEGQQNAIDALQGWWNSKEQNIVLSGSPGTGKTFLAKFFVNSLNGCVPLFTAPTNEAVITESNMSVWSTLPAEKPYAAAERETSKLKSVTDPVVIGRICSDEDISPAGRLLREKKST